MLGVPPPATVLIIIIKNCYYFDAMRCDAMRCDAMPYFLLSKHFTHMYSVCSPTFVRSISHLCSHFEYICSSACLISC